MNASHQKITRRSFLKGTAAGLISASVTGGNAAIALAEEQAASPVRWSWETGPLDITDDMVSEIVDTEVCVIGAGITGCSAVAGAARAGAKVVCIDKQSTYEAHGNAIGVVNSQYQQSMGYGVLDKSSFMSSYINMFNGAINAPLVLTYVNESGAAFDWLASLFPGDTWLVDPSEPFDKYEPGSDPFPCLVPPLLRVSPEQLATGDKSAYSDNWVQTVGAIYQFGIDNGAVYYHNVDGRQLIQDGAGRVIGAYGLKEDGTYLQVNASKGVIICTGGFQGNNELLHAFMPERCHDIEILTGKTDLETGTYAQGQGLIMAMWAGASYDCEGIPSMREASGCLGSTPTLYVNRNGKRFTNESIPCWSMTLAASRQPGITVFQLFDANFADMCSYQGSGHNSMAFQVGRNALETLPADIETAIETDGPIESSYKGRELYAANSWEELAEKIGIPAESLVATVERYNELCTAGVDEDFGKHPNFMYALTEPPFCASPCVAGTGASQTMGGIRTDGDCAVIRPDGSVIEGLWCAGNCQGGRFFGAYETPINAISHGFALTHGLHAGAQAATA